MRRQNTEKQKQSLKNSCVDKTGNLRAVTQRMEAANKE